MKFKIKITGNLSSVKNKLKLISSHYYEDFLLPDIVFVDINKDNYYYLKSIKDIKIEKESYGYLTV